MKTLLLEVHFEPLRPSKGKEAVDHFPMHSQLLSSHTCGSLQREGNFAAALLVLSAGFVRAVVFGPRLIRLSRTLLFACRVGGVECGVGVMTCL